MKATDSKSWAQLKKHHRAFALGFAAMFIAPIAALQLGVQSVLVVGTVMVIGLTVTLLLGSRVKRFRCPNCGKHFVDFFSTPFVIPRRCANCQHPRPLGASRDPV